MPTHYELLGCPHSVKDKNAIKPYVQKKLKEIKKMKIPFDQKKKLEKNVKDAYTVLSDYHTRHEYDNSIHNHIVSYRTPSLFPNLESMKELMNNEKDKNFFHQSTHIVEMDKDGGKTVLSNMETNKNGKIEKNSKKIIYDKHGNKIEKPLSKSELESFSNIEPFSKIFQSFYPQIE